MRLGRRSVAVIVLMLMSGALTACGFHLRGAVVLPEEMERTYLQGVPVDSALAEEVKAVLDSSGGAVVTRLADATAILQLGGERTDRRVASVDSSGKVREYSLRYSLPFTLLTPAGDVLLPTRTVQTARSYNFDPDNVLGAGTEEAVLLREMRGFAVRQMIRQVRMAAMSDLRPAAAGPEEAGPESADEGP